MRYLLTLALLIFYVATFSQNYCGFDGLNRLNDQTKANELNDLVYGKILDARSNGAVLEDYTIPVVVHIIHENGLENISDEQVELAIQQLNEAFHNTGEFQFEDGVDTQISFCLASQDEDGNFSTGITRTENSLTEMLVPSQDAALKDVSRWDTEKYMNIWVVKSIVREEDNEGVIGYATFPDAHGTETDGIVCEANFFGVGTSSSKVHIHETGHYLGLYHTFQAGCPNDDCLASGDLVCDTPPDSEAFSFFCGDGANSCSTDDDDTSDNNPFRPLDFGGLGDQLDMKDNYLDYSNLVCMKRFSFGQAERMQSFIENVRSSLLDGDQCQSLCTSQINIDVDFNNASYEVLENFSPDNNSSNFSDISWYVDGVLFSTDQEPVFNFPTQGIYEIEVVFENGDIACEENEFFYVEVVCPIESTFTVEDTQISIDEVISITNTSVGADSYVWIVEGEVYSSEETIEISFDEAGVYTIQLEASNDDCTVSSIAMNILVGFCSTGNQANQWYFQLPTANVYGFDFNQDNILIIENPNIPTPYVHNKSSICDAAGNLLFHCTGPNVMDKDFNIMPNGSGLSGGTSAYGGSMFVEAPGSDNLYYLFTADDNESNFSNGLRYSVIDKNLNNGLGDVTEIKDVPVEVTGAESFTAISHCDNVSFWLVAFDVGENVFKSWLVDENGVDTNPVVSPSGTDFTGDNIQLAFITPNRTGDRIIVRDCIFQFDQATGDVSLMKEFDMQFPIGYAFSPSGKFVYYQTGDIDITLNQVNIQGDPSTWDVNEYSIPMVFTDFSSQMITAPDGRIYGHGDFGDSFWRINSPDSEGAEMQFQSNWMNSGAVVNTFGNYYHEYLMGNSFGIDGPDVACIGSNNEFSILGSECGPADAEWEVIGEATFEVVDGNIIITPLEPGLIYLSATGESECGILFEEKLIEAIEAPVLDLGPDVNLCAGTSLTITADEGFDTYIWQDQSQGQSLEIDELGVYSLTATYNGCIVQDEIEVLAEINGEIDLGPDVELCDGEILVLDAGNDFVDYVWQDGFPGAVYTLFEAGTYTVTATIPCAASDQIVVTDCGETINSVEEIEAYTSIYPNPFDNQLVIESKWNIDRFQIFDATGRLIQEEQSLSDLKIEISTVDLSEGVYLLKAYIQGIEINQRILKGK